MSFFLGEAYQKERHKNEPGYVDTAQIKGFEITEEHWERGRPLRAISDESENTIGVVHSKGNAALRYAATGIYASASEEVAVATDDIEVALGRVEGQGFGIIIA